MAEAEGLPLPLGKCYRGRLSEDMYLLNMVAQRGVGQSNTPRLRYVALETCLDHLAEMSKELSASVHMPRIGTGHAGGDWEVIRELIADILVKQGVPVTVYSLPSEGAVKMRNKSK